MSWGYIVTLISAGFVLFMSLLVYGALKQDFDLVTEDYYGRELQFQTQIDKEINQTKLNGSIRYVQEEEDIKIIFPEELINKNIEGEIFFFRPSDASKDIKFKIISDSGSQIINKNELSVGLYNVQIDYKAGNTGYYSEEKLFVY